MENKKSAKATSARKAESSKARLRDLGPRAGGARVIKGGVIEGNNVVSPSFRPKK